MACALVFECGLGRAGFVAEKRWGSAWRVGSPALAGVLRVVLFGVVAVWSVDRGAAVLLVF